MTRFGLDINHDELVYSSDEDEEEEEPHPLGFASSCRYAFLNNSNSSLSVDGDEYSIRRPDETHDEYRRRMGYLHPYDDDAEFVVRELTPQKQQYPPLESYINASVIPTKDLIRYATESPTSAEFRDDHVDALSLLLKAASTTEKSNTLSKSITSTISIQSITRPYQLMQADGRKIQQEMEQERSKLARNHQAAVQAFQTMLRHNEEAADKIRAEQARRDAAADEARIKEEERQEEQRQNEQESRLKQQKDDDDQREKRRQEQEAVAAQEQAQRAAAAKEMEYLVRAEKLMTQLKEIRASAATFEASAAPLIKRRRLQMKKLVGGKVNTLAENAGKIQSVATDVSQAITAACDEDEMAKQQLAAGDGNYSREMGRGKRYLVDLLCSKVMVRVQSEGFNGQRGDGFPLANMLALVSTEHKDVALVLEAHIYTECPTAIPRLPVVESDASEEELMASLGMKQNTDGSSETFKRFLDRTESIISLVADVMSSKPESHTLLGGHEAAIIWLKRFLSALPDAPTSPLPLLTAPVLDAFLTGAGHMLANLHGEAFHPLLDGIMKDIVRRLDEGPIGAPSATRLKKTVSSGFDGFKQNLPSKALPELYSGKAGGIGGGGGGGGGIAFSSSQQSSPFQNQPSISRPSFPSGAAQAIQAAPANNPFGLPGSNAPSTGQSPFGTPQAPFGSAPAPLSFPQSNQDGFSMSTDNATNPSPFTGSTTAAASSPFGGGGGAAAPSPFSQPASQAQVGLGSPFGVSSNQANNNTPFGASSSVGSQPANTSSPFGTVNAPAPVSSPFGAPSTGQGQAAPFGGSPFGGGATSSTPFGGGTSTSTPFGGGSNTSTPFGGGATSSTPFGGGSGGPTPFGGGTSSSTPFGGGSSSSTQFGGGGGGISSKPFAPNNNSSTPFGVSGTTTTPFGGGSSAPTPFGSSGAFGGGSSNSGFGQPQSTGGYGQPQKPGGGFGGGGSGRSKTPCKFFAKGTCRFGNNCKFSHDTGGGGFGFSGGNPNSGGFGSSFQTNSTPFSTPFGGPRR